MARERIYEIDQIESSALLCVKHAPLYSLVAFLPPYWN
jgi:hypothetical protein